MADDGVIERLVRLERQVEELRREVAALAALTLARAPGEAASPVPIEVEAAAAAVPPATLGSLGAAPAAGTPLARAWRALERGEVALALDKGFEASRLARATRDSAALDELAELAAAASSFAPASLRERADMLVREVDAARRTKATGLPIAPPSRGPLGKIGAPPEPLPPQAAEAPPPRPDEHPPPPAPPPLAPAPTPSFGERAVAWCRAELTGARLFALVGGSVMLLGVVFLFVLAANRGWIGPAERVALGAAVSAAAVIAGIALRIRYGRYQAALAAVGAGLAGAYTTLAAATILYAYLPTWGALVAASAIAAVGGGLGVAWSSQILAGLALGGAAAAPGLVALDDGIGWPGTAFALIVLAATVAVASPRRWLVLDGLVAGLAVAQIAWLAADAPTDDAGAVAVACAGALVLLAAAIAWQWHGEPELDGTSATFAFTACAVALWPPIEILSERTAAGLVLLGLAVAFAAAALAIRTRRTDLAWTIGSGSLLLGGVAAAYLVSGRSLTVVWAIEAAALAGLGWKIRVPRFAAAGLAYLAAASVNALAVEILPDWPEDAFDVPRGAAVGLFVLAAAALAAALLLPSSRADRPSTGIAAALEPLWDGLVRRRIELRAWLACGAAVALAGATAAVLSGRWLTILWAATAAVLAAAAYAPGERRLQPFAFAFLALGIVHALVVEAPPEAFALTETGDALAPVASIAALGASAAVLAALARFETRGIAWLGPLAGPELHLGALEREQSQVRAIFAFAAAVASAWALGLMAIEASFESGQVVATALWAVLGTAVVTLAGRRGDGAWQGIGGAVVMLAFAKSAFFDWHELDEAAAVASLLVAATALLLAGFLLRWERPREPAPVEIVSLTSGAVAGVAALVALERALGDSRALGVAALGVVAATAAAAVPPYLRRRAGSDEPWPRPLANGYWALALAGLLFVEWQVVLHGAAGTVALWGATALALALAWRPLDEERVWLAAAGLAAASALGSLALVTVPGRLVDASEHPATGLWALAAVVAAAWAAGLLVPPAYRRAAPWVLAVAAALTLYAVSLAVLEVAERVQSASVETAFQRGHTALSALWGVGALALYVVGLARDRRELRVVGLALFGLALAKLFLYDLSSLSSITRAFSFLAVGAILLTAGFFAERLVRADDDAPPGAEGPTTT